LSVRRGGQITCKETFWTDRFPGWDIITVKCRIQHRLVMMVMSRSETSNRWKEMGWRRYTVPKFKARLQSLLRMCQKYKQMWAHLFWFCMLPSPYSDMRAQNGWLARVIIETRPLQRQILLMLVAKTNQEIENNILRKGMQRKCTWMMLLVSEIISKLKLEILKVRRVREYSADRACIRNIKTDLIVVST
jgi:hypothetical protein